MTRIYRYILRSDKGMAPCIEGGIVTLATCKPRIRKGAAAGDWVLGFYPRPFERGMLAWAGRIMRKLDVGNYEREFRGRCDAVYRLQNDGTFRRLNPDYHPHPNDIRKDLSASVLIFDEAATWYFGDAPHLLPPQLMHLQACGQGHRVSGSSEEDARVLAAWLFGLSPPGILGNPRHARTGEPGIRTCGPKTELASRCSTC